MPDAPSSAWASASAYSWFGPPEPSPRIVTVQFAAGEDHGPATGLLELKRHARMVGGDIPRLAHDIGAERHDFVAGFPRKGLGRIERMAGADDDLEARPAEDRVVRLRRLLGRIGQHFGDAGGDIDAVPPQDLPGVNLRRGIGNGGSGSDGRGIVARHVGDGEGVNPSGADAGREPAALDPRQMLAHAIHLADHRA